MGKTAGGCFREIGREWGVLFQVRQTRQRRQAQTDGKGGEEGPARRPLHCGHRLGRRNRSIQELHDRCNPDRAQLRPSRGAYPRAALRHQCLLRPRLLLQGGQMPAYLHTKIVEQRGYRVKAHVPAIEHWRGGFGPSQPIDFTASVGLRPKIARRENSFQGIGIEWPKLVC